tara:strand:- start:377 stop:529 length:153 start_codon:yes stop_codon:yes gene_type:complete
MTNEDACIEEHEKFRHVEYDDLRKVYEFFYSVLDVIISAGAVAQMQRKLA